MVKKKETSLLIIGAVLVIAAYFYLDTSNSLLGVFVDKISPVNWDEVHPREIIKNSIPIYLLEGSSDCTVQAKEFNYIISHQYFVKWDDLAKDLKFNNNTKTLVVPCDKLTEEKSRLHVWYVLEESPRHALKYQYFITPWDVNMTEVKPPK